MLLSSCTVANESLAPFVKNVAPRIAVPRRWIVPHLERPGIEDICAGCIFTTERTPRRFDRRAHRDAFERVQEAAVGVFALAHRMMRIVACRAIEQVDDQVG